MELKWTDQGLRDLSWLYDCLATVHQPAAARTVSSSRRPPPAFLQTRVSVSDWKSLNHETYADCLVGNYEMRYEIVNSTPYLLRVWHTREHR